MLKKAIIPALEEKGYKVELVEFSDYIQPNKALESGDIDANLFQHTIYLENFEKENDMELEALNHCSNSANGHSSRKISKQLMKLKMEQRSLFQMIQSNGARALIAITDEGLIELDPNAEALKVSEKDVTMNKKNLVFQPIEAGQLPRSVEGTDLAAVPGNFALAASMNLLDAYSRGYA